RPYKFRNILRNIGVGGETIGATERPAVTAAHNAAIAIRREERQKVGIDTQTPFKRIAELKARAKAFVKQPKTDAPSAQDAADLLVIWSARPGEEKTLRPGPNGGVIGALKKREFGGDEYPVASTVGPKLALKYLESWRARPGTKEAMSALSKLVAEWGIKRPDLR